VPETVVLRASWPFRELLGRFIAAMGQGADVELVVEGRIAKLLLPRLVPKLARGGGESKRAAAMLAPVVPGTVALLLQAKAMGRTFTCQKVSGAREVVIEFRVRAAFPGQGAP